MKTSHTPSNPRVLIAGANGFIGQHLLENLWKKYDITAISRRQVLKEVKSKFSSVEWVQADFFSRSQTIDALKAADIGIYLIHSMSPTSEFERGRFQNRDLLLADNFLYAAAKNNLKPADAKRELSRKLLDVTKQRSNTNILKECQA